MYIRKLFSIFVFCLCSTISLIASANPARIMLWGHGNVRPDENGITTIRSEFAISNIETSNLFTYVYVGAGFDLSKYVRLDLFGGYDTNDEIIASPRLVMSRDKFSTFSLIEYYSKNRGGYIFQTIDYELTKWLQSGAEYEWFGSYKTIGDSSHGFGPHIIFNLGRYGLDTVLQTRQYMPGDWHIAPVIRMHLFL